MVTTNERLIERLRNAAAKRTVFHNPPTVDRDLLREAADRLGELSGERVHLRRQIERLRSELAKAQ